MMFLTTFLLCETLPICLAAAVLLWSELGLRLERRACCVGEQLVLGKRGWRESPQAGVSHMLWEPAAFLEPQGRA